jgi:hypothetical protein
LEFAFSQQPVVEVAAVLAASLTIELERRIATSASLGCADSCSTAEAAMAFEMPTTFVVPVLDFAIRVPWKQFGVERL